MNLDLYATIRSIKYTPLLCRKLDTWNFEDLDRALNKEGAFKLKIDEVNEIAVSWWVSPKRTRSYPYARVYDTLCFSGRRVTIIPIMKDEGIDGDRDYLQWDTISLMNLLNVYVIIGYYKEASKNPRYENKITNQKFDLSHIKREILNLMRFQSDALHWNLEQIEKIKNIGEMALKAYNDISKSLHVKMHPFEKARERIKKMSKAESFRDISRKLAKKAQKREVRTNQPKERVTGKKATITIKNYQGGIYFFTVDEISFRDEEIWLIEAKHTQSSRLPSKDDIKDGLLKMVLYTNLEEVRVKNRSFRPVPVLKLTTQEKFDLKFLDVSQRKLLKVLIEEAKQNKFKILINNKILV